MTDKEALWASIFERARDAVANLNRNNQELTFRKVGTGFQITRESPYLSVQRWIGEGSVFGSFESRDANGYPTPGLVPPVVLRDNGHGEVFLESDGHPVTVEDVVSHALLVFLDTSNGQSVP